MPVKVKLGSRSGGFFSGLVRLVLVGLLFCALCGAAVFGYFYFKYQKVVDDRLAAGPLFASVAQIYAAPTEVRVGQHLTVEAIAADLRTAGYNSNPQLGTYQQRVNSILIKPGPQSYHNADGATVTTQDGDVVAITAENGVSLGSYELEPQLITALSEDKLRTKRRIVTYDEIPSTLVKAVIAIEDRRFFEHGGVNYVRMAKCAEEDIVSHQKECGGSTLTMQIARGFFLSPEKKFTRKLSEIMISFQLESRFTKPQIFAMYANEINLGQRGSYAINGFAEASQAFFGKDMSRLDLAECATLAGLIQNPNRRNLYRHPDRAMERRNVVLDSMVETGAITADQAEAAKAEPLRLAPPNVDASEAPYFVDLVHEQLVQRLGDDLNHQNLRIYTSLDPQLQRAASDAVEVGMRNVDALIRRLHGKSGPINYPQVALVALDPHTGQILALVGGRNYGTSQLDHALAERPTGSIFKPFVYATAYNTSLNGTELDGSGVFTALTKLNDDPTDFGGGYTPGNFEKGEYPGMVTAVAAIEHSLNIATIALAQKVGYDNVAALARSAGIVNARGTPSVAIGTYNSTPIEMAGAYTVFANGGVHLDPWAVSSVRSTNGDLIADMPRTAKQVMDPRSAYLTQSLLENVMTYGTASSVRAKGFTAPAAGKTGTSHDVWFAGYSSNLICLIWIGNDDYTDISTGLTHKVQGSDTAAPIWAEFMMRAIKLPQYSDMHAFTKPEGVTDVRIDRITNLPADDTCPNDFTAAFLDGTIPAGTCSRMSDSGQSIVNQVLNGATPPTPDPVPGDTPSPPAKKPNILKRLFGGGNNPTPALPPQHL
jgi:penicillin-binding protein 1B